MRLKKKTPPAPPEQPQMPPPPARPPVADYMRTRPRGTSADGAYLVLPAAALVKLTPEVQQQLVAALNQTHQQLSQAPWPTAYRVQAVRWGRLEDLNEQQLRAEANVLPEIDDDGQMVHRDLNTGELLDKRQQVLVPTPDALVPRRPPTPTPPAPPVTSVPDRQTPPPAPPVRPAANDADHSWLNESHRTSELDQERRRIAAHRAAGRRG